MVVCGGVAQLCALEPRSTARQTLNTHKASGTPRCIPFPDRAQAAKNWLDLLRGKPKDAFLSVGCEEQVRFLQKISMLLACSSLL